MSDVFISGISHKINGHSLKKGLQLPCRSINIHHFSVQLIRGRNSPCAILTLPSKELADLFVICYGSSGPRSKPRLQLQIGSQNVYCRHSDKPTRDLLVVRSLVEQQNQAMKEHHKVLASAPRDTPASKKLTKSFPITGFELGTWATETLGGSTTVFNPRYLVRRAGTLHFRPQSVMIELEPVARPASGRSAEAQRYTLVMFYHQIYQVVTDSRNDVFLSLGTAPRIYINKKTDDPYLGEKLSRERISGIDEVHEGYSGFSFIYKVILKNGQAGDHSKVLRLGGTAGIPPVNPSFIITLPPKIDFIVAFEALMKRLQDPELGYRVAFQLHALMSNGIIPPESVLMILPRVRKLVQQVGRRVSAEILKAFVVDDFGAVGVQDDPTMASEQRLLQTLEERINMMKQYLTPRYFEDQEKKHESMAYVHKAMITPTGVFATGPFWEASNRVLREYSDFQDHFLRVSFCEEDGEQFMHEMRVTADRILQDKFLSRLDPTNEDGKIVIAGRKFQFLGFSNSSLKSQTCWYMAPFECNGRVINPKILIESLGDFSEIRTPGRYAARIGQAFSDTIGSAYVQAGSEIRIDDVERTDQFGKLRNFSDGIGKISMEMVQRIWKTSEQIELARPTVFQIRYAGAKGVVRTQIHPLVGVC